MSKRKKIAGIMIGIILIVIATVAICYFLFYQKPKDNLLYDDNATTGIMPGVDTEQRKKELQSMLDESMIAFSINTTPRFLNGTSNGNLLIENPGNNAKLLTVSIQINDTQEEIYTTNLLKPGSYIENAKLDKVLKKGTYKATAYFDAYDEETTEHIGRTGAEIVLVIEN